MNETRLSDNINKLRKCDGPLTGDCSKAFNEVMDFVKGGSKLAKEMADHGKLQQNGENGLTFTNDIYPQDQLNDKESGKGPETSDKGSSESSGKEASESTAAENYEKK